MSDYRDDRAALHARVDQQETELARLRGEVDRLRPRAEKADALEEQVARMQETAPPKKKKNAAPLVVALALLAVSLGAGVFMVLLTQSAPPQQTVAVSAPPATATDKAKEPKPAAPAPPPRMEALTCRCDSARGGATLAYTPGAIMSFGSSTTYFVTWSLAAEGAGPLQLRAGPRTVPANKIEGGDLTLELACTRDAMILALDQRATAWSLDDGRELWSAALPAPVGGVRGGELSPKCERLKLDAKGNVVIPHAGGTAVLRASDGATVR